MRIVSLLFLAALSLPAAILNSAQGSSLAGGTIKVVWGDSFSQTFTMVVEAGCCAGSAQVDPADVSPGALFKFQVDNQTLDNPWLLRNLRPGGSNIVSFEIDLSLALSAGFRALFDSGATLGSPAEAPGSESDVPSAYGGTDGVRAISGATISSFVFSLPFLDEGGTNMWSRLSVTLGGTGLAVTAGDINTGGLFFNADSDRVAVPEPATWLTALAFCAVGLYRRNRRS